MGKLCNDVPGGKLKGGGGARGGAAVDKREGERDLTPHFDDSLKIAIVKGEWRVPGFF